MGVDANTHHTSSKESSSMARSRFQGRFFNMKPTPNSTSDSTHAPEHHAVGTPEKSQHSKSPSATPLSPTSARAASPASTSESHASARDLEDVSRGRSRKKLVKHPKSKHRNVVDPVFVAEVDSLTNNIGDICLGLQPTKPPNATSTSPLFRAPRFVSPDSATPELPPAQSQAKPPTPTDIQQHKGWLS